VEAELPLIEQADHVVFSSRWLEEYVSSRVKIAEQNRSVLRNAVQQHFLDACTAGRDSRALQTVGYFGALDSWFDIEAVRRAAQSYPNVRFQLIGRVEYSPVLALKSLSNVEFRGEVPYTDLPGLLMQFDVGLIPFQVNDLTCAANPIKLYEYFSAGIPVVSTRLPEVEQFGELVYIADGPERFAEMVGSALAEVSPDWRARRIAAAAGETWEHRAQRLLQIAHQLSSVSRARGI
jgi:glycosyltransferase involved in cell wall biosynthesis